MLRRTRRPGYLYRNSYCKKLFCVVVAAVRDAHRKPTHGAAMAEEKQPGGAYDPKGGDPTDATEAAFAKHDNRPLEHGGGVGGMISGLFVGEEKINASGVMAKAIKEGEESAEPRRGGAYEAKSTAVDCKPAIDERCSHRCHHQWEDYERCAKRIEAKGEGECSGWYMDYLTCVDKCAAQVLFKTLS